jgi:hypothetical protein
MLADAVGSKADEGVTPTRTVRGIAVMMAISLALTPAQSSHGQVGQVGADDDRERREQQ